MNAWKEYQNLHKDRFLNELLDLLRIPSISARGEHKSDMVACAEAVRDSILAAGATKAVIYETPGHPIVYGEIITDPAKPTVLVYGHYDVQPADPLELWHSGPFEPVINDGKIFARGACDDCCSGQRARRALVADQCRERRTTGSVGRSLGQSRGAGRSRRCRRRPRFREQ